MIRQKFCVNKKLVERWKKSLNSRDIPEAAAAASTGCASLSRLSATMQQCSLCSCSICIAHCMSSFLCHKFACAFFVDYVPCTVVQTVTTSTWYTEHCKVSNTSIFRTGLQSSEATASVSQCQSSERQPFFPAPPSILTRRHAQLCFDTVLWHSGGMLNCASAILGSTFTWRSAKPVPALEIQFAACTCL